MFESETDNLKVGQTVIINLHLSTVIDTNISVHMFSSAATTASLQSVTLKSAGGFVWSLRTLRPK